MKKMENLKYKESKNFMALPASMLEKLNEEEVLQVKGGNKPDEPPVNKGTGCVCG